MVPLLNLHLNFGALNYTQFHKRVYLARV